MEKQDIGYFADGSQYIIKAKDNGRYEVRRFWGDDDFMVYDDVIEENVRYEEAMQAVIDTDCEIAEGYLL